jgi:hypothetical protein
MWNRCSNANAQLLQLQKTRQKLENMAIFAQKADNLTHLLVFHRFVTYMQTAILSLRRRIPSCLDCDILLKNVSRR